MCLFTVYLLPFIVLISRELLQRRWLRLATEYAGVDKLPDYLRSDTKDFNQEAKNQLSLTAVIICLATVNYQKNNWPPLMTIHFNMHIEWIYLDYYMWIHLVIIQYRKYCTHPSHTSLTIEDKGFFCKHTMYYKCMGNKLKCFTKKVKKI